MTSRATRWSALAVAGAFALAACAQGNAGGKSDATFDDAASLSPGTFTTMGFAMTDEIGQTRWDLSVEAIKPMTPKPIEGDFDMQVFLSANSSGNSPDAIHLDRDQVGGLANLGALMPLTDCIKGEKIATADYQPAALAQVTFDDVVYAVPEFNMVQIVQANGDLLAKAGLTIADVDGSSWPKTATAATKLNVMTGGKLSVIGYDPKMPEFFPLWVKAAGGQLISDDGRTAQIDTPEALEALEFTSQLYGAQGGFAKVKALRDSADFFGAGNQYAKGQLGAMNMEQWYINVLNDVSPDVPLATAPFRSKQTGEPIAWGTGSAWAIPAKAKNPAAACRFIKTMTETDSWMAAAKARVDKRAAENKMFTGLLTGNKVADEKIRAQYVKPTGDETWDAAVAAMYEANDHLFYLPANPADVAFKKAWQDAANRVLSGQAKPKASLEQGQRDAQKALDEAWAKQKKQ